MQAKIQSFLRFSFFVQMAGGGMGGNDGQCVQFVEDSLVLRVRKVLDNSLKSLVDTLYHLVVARAEEHLYRVGSSIPGSSQSMLFSGISSSPFRILILQ